MRESRRTVGKMFSFFFAVESDPSHPVHSDPKAAWAWAIVNLPDPEEGSEAAARDSLAVAQWRAGELLDARRIEPSEFESLPPEARMVLQRHPVYAEIYSHEGKKGPEREGSPDWLRDLMEKHVQPINETVIQMRLNDNARMRLTEVAASLGLSLEAWMQRTMEEVADDLRRTDESPRDGLSAFDQPDWFEEGPSGGGG